jgi:NhaP-type Na+/H+ or K+/H+ antiporter
MVDGLVIASVVLAYALVSRRLETWWISMPMVFVTAGALFQFTGTVELEFAVEAVSHLAEFTLAVILFGDAVRMNVGRVRANVGLPARLLLVALPLTIIAGAFVNWLVIPGISLAAAALVASILAPTDAALGEAIVSDPAVPPRIRDGLNVEAGLNDGLVVPAVLAFIDLTRGELDSSQDWATFILRQIGGGIAFGVVAGVGVALTIRFARSRGWIDPLYGQLATLGTALATFILAGELDVNQFIAVFVGGLAFGATLDDIVADDLDEYTADTGVLLATIAFFVFGNLFVADALGSLTWHVVVAAMLLLTVCRIVPVAIATRGLGLRTPTVMFLGWFGPRGLASIVFGILLLEEDLPVSQELFEIVALVVVSSVFLHGLSATPGAAAYGRWYRAAHPGHVTSESVPVVLRRTRRRIRTTAPR